MLNGRTWVRRGIMLSRGARYWHWTKPRMIQEGLSLNLCISSFRHSLPLSCNLWLKDMQLQAAGRCAACSVHDRDRDRDNVQLCIVQCGGRYVVLIQRCQSASILSVFELHEARGRRERRLHSGSRLLLLYGMIWKWKNTLNLKDQACCPLSWVGLMCLTYGLVKMTLNTTQSTATY